MYKRDREPHQEYCAAKRGADVAGEEVLIIDDNQLIRDGLKLLLESEGYSVTCCADGRSAIDLAKEKRFGTFLVDYCMPGMNGDEVTLLLRQSYPEAFIIGFSAEHKDRDFLTAGANTFMLKDDIDKHLLPLLKANRLFISLS
jgi:CheY-like chemotaxis protein